MAINFDLVIDTMDELVDMKAGLASMQGVSDAIRCISAAILTEKTPKKQTHKAPVRTTLKKSFKGSYGHTFGLEIHDEGLKKRLNSIGRPAFIELVAYFMSESLYQDPAILSAKAQSVLDKLGDTAEKTVRQLRVSSLENIHEISLKFDHNVKIRYRKSLYDQTVIAKFNVDTAKVLQATESQDRVDLMIVVTRLNIHTGNGRLQIEGATETVAFGFRGEYKAVRINAKKPFSENLDKNNGVANDKWIHLRISASPVKLKDGKIVKYIIKGIYND